MIISRSEIQHVLTSQAGSSKGLEAGRSRLAAGEGRNARRADGVDLSAQARDIQKLTELVGQLPDVRMDRVGPIAQALEAGTYRVSDEEVAEKILGRSVVDHIV